ncbi:MAG: SGNH/GDSL hydrolase family protein [Planctomycetota bacterium]|jgi:hypothetical protein
MAESEEPQEEDRREETPPAPSRKRTAIKILIIGLITLALLCLSLEILGRTTPLLGPELTMTSKLTEPDPLVGVRLKPGQHAGHEIISLEGIPPEVGFRDNGVEPGAKKRILALGDSFTFGSGVTLPQCWTEQLESHLGVPVINAGMGATGPAYACRFFEHYGRKLEPDLVLYAFFSGNDVIDSGVEAGISVRRFGSARHWLHEHCVTYRAAKLVAGRVRNIGANEMERHTISVNGEEQGFWPSMLEYNSRRKPTDGFSKSLERAKSWILKLQEICRGESVPLVVVIFPFKEQIYFDSVKGWLADPSAYDPRSPAQEIVSLCSERELPVLDLTPVFVRENDRNLYGPLDTHWNAEGNALAAETLAEFLGPLTDPGKED